MPRQPAPDECAQCGARIPRGARACPECGADERTGWREASPYDGLELPDQAWEDDSESRDRPRADPGRVNGLRWYWWAIALAVLVLFGLVVLRLR